MAPLTAMAPRTAMAAPEMAKAAPEMVVPATLWLLDGFTRSKGSTQAALNDRR